MISFRLMDRTGIDLYLLSLGGPGRLEVFHPLLFHPPLVIQWLRSAFCLEVMETDQP
jgi:hypothetical protein